MTQAIASLRNRVVRAGGWSIGVFFVSQIIRLGGNLIFTRFLLPEAFGLMAVVTVIMVGIVLISDWGISQGIIRSQRGNESDYLNTAWTIQILQGIFLSSLMVLVAILLPIFDGMGWIPKGSVYTNPELPWLIVVFSLTPLIHAFDSTKVAEARRMLRLDKLSKMEIISQCSAMVVMLGLLSVYRSVWILVVGAIVTSTVRCYLSHTWLEGNGNRFRWEKTSVRDIFHFGAGLTVVTIFGFLSTSGDRLILASLVNSSTLGIYSIAYLLTNTVVSLFNNVLSNVVFPALSEVSRDHPENMRKVYSKFQLISDLILFSVAAIFFAAGNYLVSILYDNRYADAGIILPLLAFGLIGIRYGVVEQFYLVKRELRRLAVANMSRSVAMCFGLPLGFYVGGMKGGIVAIVLSQFAGWPVALQFKFTHGLIDLKQGIAAFIGLLIMVTIFINLAITARLS